MNSWFHYPGWLMVRHVFIVTYGRTGSTVLMNVLNAIEGVVIVGENRNHIYDLWRVFTGLHDWQELGANETPTHPFFGSKAVPFQARRDAILTLIERYFDSWPRAASTDIRGFKEVRYVLPDFQEYMDFLDQTFGNALFICLTRAAEQCVGSGFYKNFYEADVLAVLAKANQDFCELAERKPASVFDIDYSDLFLGSTRLDGLFERLGRRPDAESLAQRLGEPTSYDRRSWQQLSPGTSLLLDLPAIERAGLLLRIDRAQEPPIQEPPAAILKGVALSLGETPIESIAVDVAGHRLEATLGLRSGGLERSHPEL